MPASDDVIVRLRLRDAKKFQSDASKSGKSMRGFGDDTKHANTALSGFKTTAKNVGVGLGGLAVVGAGLATVLGIDAYKAFEDSRKVAAQTESQLKATGGAAGVSADDIGKLAMKISNKTGIDDEAIQSGQNMLLSFKDIRNEAGKGNDIFNQSSKVMANMSKLFGGDSKKSAIQLGKALQDPIKGVAALGKIGVGFTDQQKEQIKTLTESGNKLGAQKIILAELNSEVGQASGTPMEKLINSWHNFQEMLGQQIAPTVDFVAGKLGKLLSKITDLFGRKDLSLEEKLKLSVAAAKRILGPLVTEAGSSLDRMHLPEKMASLFELAMPLMANKAAAGAPRVASAFITGWWNANAWGKVITAGFLLTKLGLTGGLLRAAGRSAGRKMGLPMGNTMARTAGNASMAGPTGIGGRMEAGAKKGGFKSTLTRAGLTAGKVLGKAMALGTVAWFIWTFKDKGIAMLKEEKGILGKLWSGIKGVPGQAAKPFKKGPSEEEKRLKKALPELFKARGGLVQEFQSGGPITGSRRGDRVPSMLESGEFVVKRKSVDKLGPSFMASINEGRMPASAGAGGGETVIHTNLVVDGRVLADSVSRHTANQRARR